MTTLSAPLDSLSSLLETTYRWMKRLFVAGLLLVLLMAVLEISRLFELLARIHPAVAWTAGLVLLVPIAGWAVWRLIRYLRNPQVLVPPDLPPVEAGWNRSDLEKHRAFAIRYLRRQSSNPRLPEEARDRIPEAIEAIQAPLLAEDLWDPVRAAQILSKRTGEALDMVLAPLDAEAKRMIRRASVEVAVATAVSPSILMDAMITLARNIDLMSRLAHLYYGRPGLAGTARILRDVFGSAITAGALEVVSDHLTGVISEMAGSWTSRLLGPLGQGMVNGVVTMRFGAAARKRCRSIIDAGVPWRPWRVRDYRRAAGKLYDWLRDDMGPGFVKPMLRWLSPSGPETAEGEPGLEGPAKERFWSRLFRRVRGKDAGGTDVGEKGDESPRAIDPLLDSDLMD